MKTVTIRLPETLVADIESESRVRKVTVSDVIRDRLRAPLRKRRGPPGFSLIADVIGSVKGLPADTSGKKKAYLKATGYGRSRPH